MRIARSTFVLLLCLGFSHISEAATTLVSVSGISTADYTDSNKPIIYAGFAGAEKCSGTGTTTCDSCTGLDSGNKFFPCNFTTVTSSMKLVVEFSTDNSSALTGTLVARVGSNQVTVQNSPTVAVGVSIPVELNWSDVCNQAGAGSGCTGAIASTLTVGFDTDSDGVPNEKVDLTLRARYLDRTSATLRFSAECPDTDPDPSKNYGFCYFNVFPGDQKVYLTNLTYGQNYPATGASNIEFKKIIFFYEEQLASDGGNFATLSRITNASPAFEIGVSAVDGKASVDDKITGLDNGVNYCFVMANADATGNIYYYTQPTVGNADLLCGTPEEVVGLLAGKKCFIATAAFGSQMHPEVQVFRDFRDQYLLTTELGQWLVETYYTYGSQAALVIAQHSWLRVIARAILWPMLYFVKLALWMGLWQSLAAILISTWIVRSLWRRRREVNHV